MKQPADLVSRRAQFGFFDSPVFLGYTATEYFSAQESSIGLKYRTSRPIFTCGIPSLSRHFSSVTGAIPRYAAACSRLNHGLSTPVGTTGTLIIFSLIVSSLLLF